MWAKRAVWRGVVNVGQESIMERWTVRIRMKTAETNADVKHVLVHSLCTYGCKQEWL